MRESDPHDRARRGRRERKTAEEELWTLLRERRFRSAKFRRHHAIGPFAVDFASVGAKLVIELDGPSQATAEQAALDAERAAFLERTEWRVLRIASADVLAGDGGVYDAIETALQT